MKLCILITFFCGIGFCCSANKIDSLLYDKDVENFAIQLIPKDEGTGYQLKKPDSTESFTSCFYNKDTQSPSWKKMDFNRDGLTDLFVTLYSNGAFSSYRAATSVVILGNDNNQYRRIKIPSFFEISCYTVRPASIQNAECLLFDYTKMDYVVLTADTGNVMPAPATIVTDTPVIIAPAFQRDTVFETKKTDTLIYRCGGFVNANFTKKLSPPVSSFSFEKFDCYGGCPVFNLLINKDGTMQYTRKLSMFDYLDGSSPKPGNFRGTLREKQREEIFDLLRYMNIHSLQDQYETMGLHQPGGTLTINFADGSSKKISDNGLRGTYSLSRVYDLMYEIAENQDWKKR